MERPRLPRRAVRFFKDAVKSYRLLTSPLRLLPDFIIIGARRCGTTSLYSYLTQHPQVMRALTKEVHYFTANYDKGPDWYRSYFPTYLYKQFHQFIQHDSVITGEATPSYIYDPLVPQRVFRLKPDVKLIALLRNPVDAVYSAYQFGIKVGTYTAEEMPFEQSIKNELEQLKADGCSSVGRRTVLAPARRGGWLWHGLCVEHLKPWLAQFPREQMLILISEAFFSEPHREFQRVLNFLGLRPHALASYERLNANDYPEMNTELYEQMIEYYAPYNRQLSELVGIDVKWEEAPLCASREVR